MRYSMDLETQYDNMFNADERQRNEYAQEEAKDNAAWYLDDLTHGRHFEPNYNQQQYD